MDARLLFPNKYVAAADLIEAKKGGKDGVTLTISKVSLDSLKTERGEEKKPMVFFAEMDKRHAEGKGESKRLVMNKTNMKTIARLYGFETDEWIGKRITLIATTCEAFGAVVDCVRVKPEAPPSRNGGGDA